MTIISGTIALSSGDLLLFDEVDRAFVERYRWYADRGHSTLYAKTNVLGENGRRTTAYLHRLLLSAPKGLVVDHINHNGLDNRRGNLRLGTQGQNLANLQSLARNTSGARGVAWDKSINRWRARINIGGRQHFLGTYKEFDEAREAYNRAAIAAWGKWFAVRESA